MNLDKLIDLLMKEKRNNRQQLRRWSFCPKARSGKATRCRSTASPTPSGTARKPVSPRPSAPRSAGSTGEETIVSDLTYDLRSGDPDFVDKLVAANFGNMALDAVLAGKSGVMAALVDGRYALAPIPDPNLGPRKVDVASMYNTDRYRPNYANKLGLPIFLTQGMSIAGTFVAAPATRFARPIPAAIRAFFNEAAADEEHFPSTIDPRIHHVKLVLDHSGRSQRQTRRRRGLRQGPLRSDRERAQFQARPWSRSILPKRCSSRYPPGSIAWPPA